MCITHIIAQMFLLIHFCPTYLISIRYTFLNKFHDSTLCLNSKLYQQIWIKFPSLNNNTHHGIWSSTCHEGTGNIWGNKSKNKYAQPNMPALEHKQEIFAYGNEIEQQ